MAFVFAQVNKHQQEIRTHKLSCLKGTIALLIVGYFLFRSPNTAKIKYLLQSLTLGDEGSPIFIRNVYKSFTEMIWTVNLSQDVHDIGFGLLACMISIF